MHEYNTMMREALKTGAERVREETYARLQDIRRRRRENVRVCGRRSLVSHNIHESESFREWHGQRKVVRE